MLPVSQLNQLPALKLDLHILALAPRDVFVSVLTEARLHFRICRVCGIVRDGRPAPVQAQYDRGCQDERRKLRHRPQYDSSTTIYLTTSTRPSNNSAM